MEKGFTFTDPQRPEPVRIEQVFAEKPGGGRVANSPFEMPATTAVGLNANGIYAPVKAYRLVEEAAADATSIKIDKGSGIAVGDILATGKKGVACTAVDSSDEEFDAVTVTLGVKLAKGSVLYQAKAASAAAAEPLVSPEYVTGNTIPANNGDTRVRLINGANLRKETANISSEVAALLPTIKLV